MEQLIAAAAFSIMGIGLIACVLALIQFTRSFGPARENASPPSTTAEGHSATSHSG